MDTVHAAIRQAVASAAQTALGATLDVLTELNSSADIRLDTPYCNGYRNALDDVGRRVAQIMDGIAATYTAEVDSDEV